jgi:N-acetylmuramoyl-L-alanine amidase
MNDIAYWRRKMTPEFIIVHHSLTEDGQTVSWPAIRKYHVEVNGWKDIGYHAGIELVNSRHEILLGRMENEPGAHCTGFNDRSLGIVLLGNYDKAKPGAEALELLKKWCRSKMVVYNIPVEKVIGHWETYEMRDMAPQKSCPGVFFSMADFRASL